MSQLKTYDFYMVYNKYGNCELRFIEFNADTMTLTYSFIDSHGTHIKAVYGGSEQSLKEDMENSKSHIFGHTIKLENTFPIMLEIDGTQYIRGH